MMDYIRSLLTLVFAISVMYMLLDCEVKRKKNRYLLGLYAIVVIICNALIILNFGYLNFMKYYPLSIQFPVFLAFVFVSKFKVIKVFFVHLTAVAITTSFVFIGLIFSTFFRTDMAITNIVCYILYLPTWFIIYRYIRPTFLYMLRNTDKGWFGFCIIPLSYSALAYFTTKYNHIDIVVLKQVIAYSVLVFILTFASYVLILRLFKQTSEQLTMQNEQKILKAQMSAAQTHLEILEKSEEKAIIYRHDLRHHLNLIDAYLTDNDIDQAKKYIADIENNLNNAVIEKYCENRTVNLILTSYINKAKAENITVESHMDLPQKIAVADMDLCVILANALENAINACKSIPNIELRKMSINCKEKQGKLFIQTSNSFIGKVDFVDELPQSHNEHHGFGTKSITSIAEKYGGIYSFTAENGIFKASVII